MSTESSGSVESQADWIAWQIFGQHNPECIRAVMSIALFMKISSAADTLFYAILSSRVPKTVGAKVLAHAVQYLRRECD
jgi:hypothetical protein